MDLVFATHNSNKLIEVRARIPKSMQVLGLDDIGWQEEIPETSNTIRGNAVLKARAVHRAMGIACFSDDTGLEVDALNGKPGVYSARFAGPEKDAEKNMDKLLDEMRFVDNRAAQFKTCVALCLDGEVFVFQGIVQGQISTSRRGEGGFGYDPIFMPQGYSKSFAEMSMEEKNTISHRALAVNKLLGFLHKLA